MVATVSEFQAPHHPRRAPQPAVRIVQPPAPATDTTDYKVIPTKAGIHPWKVGAVREPPLPEGPPFSRGLLRV
ncbi:hypothetical protein SBA2_270062 [Acidobacteriia bacterium SbA2]|nr:hypothetical protein SBA2_270062 [Acidobacteriia bacterium SbA2]